MRVKNTIIGILVLVVLVGCGSEFKLANRFVERSRQTQAAVYFPETALVTLIQDDDGTYTEVLDSLNQNVFLDVMYLAYSDEMKAYGVNVYIPNDPDRVPVDSTHWLVILSKVEIQGLFVDYIDYLFDFNDEYSYSFKLNAVNVASWFDINDGTWHPTLYDEHNLMDDFNSHVTQSLTQGTQYHYEIKPILADDVYNYAVYLGKRYAAFTYDYMMNRYIGDELKRVSDSARFKLSWDPYEGSLFFSEEGEGFIELINEN